MTTKSRNLAVISKEKAERRRRPRLNLTTEQFRLAPQGKIFSVADISETGMAFRVLDLTDMGAVPVATVITGTLNLRGEKYPVRAQVKHLGRDLVGCEFMDLEPGVREALARLLDPAVLGRELRALPSTDGATLWYHGPSNTDLLFSRGGNGEYHRLTLYVLGLFIQWDHEAGLVTGNAAPSDESRGSEDWGVIRFESTLTDADATPDQDKLSVAKALILSSNLPQDLKTWSVRQLGGTTN